MTCLTFFDHRIMPAMVLAAAAAGLLHCSSPPLPVPDAGMDAGVDVPYVEVVLFDGGIISPDAPPQWPCPAEWVPFERGGCGPAVILCADGGGAASGSCEQVDTAHPRYVGADAGASATTFFWLPDGGIGGGWSIGSWAQGAASPVCPPGWGVLPDGTCDSAVPMSCPDGTGALPGASCTHTGEQDCPSTPYADVSAETVGATVLYVSASADPSMADGSMNYPFATLGAAAAQAGTDAWLLVAAGVYNDSLSLSGSIHVVGQCAAHVSVMPAGTTPAINVQGTQARLDLRGTSLSGPAGALSVGGGASARITGVQITGASGAAMTVSDPGTAVTATDLLVSGTQPVIGGAPGLGIQVLNGASLSAGRLYHGNNHDGLVVSGDGSTLTLTDSVLTGALARFDGSVSAGLHVMAGANATVSRVVINANRGIGVLIDGAGSMLGLTQTSVQGTLPVNDAAPGGGIQTSNGAVMTATGVVVSGNRGYGLQVSGHGSSATLADTAVVNTLPLLSGIDGQGIVALASGAVVASRVLVAANTEGGIVAAPGSVSLQDVIVSGLVPSVRGLGYGVIAAGAGAITAARVSIVNVAAVGLGATPTHGAAGAGGGVQARDLFVRGVSTSTIAVDPTNMLAPAGAATAYTLYAGLGTSVQLTDVVADDGTFGVVASSGVLTLANGLITRHSIAGLLNTAATGHSMFTDVTLSGNAANEIQVGAVADVEPGF